jgi:DNA-directed RNA polymerase subunit M/transcription elongation factor TFIIS
MRTIKIYCQNCNTLLYKYHKQGLGHLVKCYKERIIKDYTNGDLKCPKCGEQFARETMVYGQPADKIIQGKIFIKS